MLLILRSVQAGVTHPLATRPYFNTYVPSGDSLPALWDNDTITALGTVFSVRHGSPSLVLILV